MHVTGSEKKWLLRLKLERLKVRIWKVDRDERLGAERTMLILIKAN